MKVPVFYLNVRFFSEFSRLPLLVQHIDVVPREGMTCYLARIKGDRQYRGTSFKPPALSRLCPVSAYSDWIALAHLTGGPVFRSIDRWGHIAAGGLHINSLVPLLRALFYDAGMTFVDQYRGHSLRRGFANWAASNGWDLKTLMEQNVPAFIKTKLPLEKCVVVTNY